MTEHPDEPMDDIDLAILDSLHRTLTLADPIPPHLVSDIEFSLSLAAMNAEFALLADEPLGVRAPTAESADSVTFTSSTMTLMVVIGRDDGQLRIDAWVSGGGITVELIQGGRAHRSSERRQRPRELVPGTARTRPLPHRAHHLRWPTGHHAGDRALGPPCRGARSP